MATVLQASISASPPASDRLVLQGAALPVHRLISDRARAHPDSEAICSWDCNISYGELDSLSSRLAGYLASNGVEPEVVVPLLFEKSAWPVVSMIAVMKAGGAFLPLDVIQPASRLRSIIEQSGAKVALSSATSYEFCSSLVKTFAVTWPSIRDLDTPRYHWPAALGNAAYVMATSGSTGTPKTITTEHSQLTHFVKYFTRTLGFTDKTRTFQFASYAFDPIIGDIFLTLTAGGTVCIPSEDDRKNDIVGAMRRMQVSLAKFTPSLVGSLASLTPGSVPTLKTLILGGETTPHSIIENWASSVDLKLIYGSTECTISCVVADASTRVVVSGEVGRPVGSQAWVTNSKNINELVKNGEIGELVVGGPLVARGYMNSPSQTEARFIKPPKWFDTPQDSSHSCYRLYRTGDLVRQLDNGNLIYVGRLDNQIKIRGQRLELEEAEFHLRQALYKLPDIVLKDILVDTTSPHKTTTKQLVAFVSLESKSSMGSLLLDDERGATISLSPTTQHNFAKLVSTVEAWMKSTVPSYMIPSLWIPIENMPYTLSRKRDRQRLKKAIESLPTNWLISFSRLDLRLLTETEPDTSSMTEKEKLLQELWSDILDSKTELVHLTDNFFHLGGNSLSVLRLISLARQREQNLTADDVFGSPILKDLAMKLRPTKTSLSLAPFALLDPSQKRAIHHEAAKQCGLFPESIEDIYPLYSMQEHYITGYPEVGRDLAGPWDWQQQIVFLLPDAFDVPLFQSTWNNAVERHSQLRTRVVQTSYGMFQVVLGKESGPRWRNVGDLEKYVRQDKVAIMSFGDELLRLTIATTGKQRYFVLTIQHLIYDAYARDRLFSELEAEFLQRNIPTIAPPPQMNKFIQYVNEIDRSSAINFWSSYLAGSSTRPLLSAPLGSRVDEIHCHKMVLNKPDPLSYCTLATIIEISGALAIAQRLDCSDVIFYSDRAGRNLPVEGIQDLVAPTTLFLPLRVHIERTQTVYDLLCAHQAATTAMIPYEHINWTELREEDHLKSILQHSLNINVNPYTPLCKLGEKMGLRVVCEHETCDDPFGINVAVGENEIEWLLYFDENFISQTVVMDLALDLRKSFLFILEASENQKTYVGDVLDHIGICARNR